MGRGAWRWHRAVAGGSALFAVSGLVGLGPAGSAAAPPRAAEPGVISTFAGGAGGPGLATTVALAGPCGLAAQGTYLYVGGGDVRKVSTRTGQLTTLAGDNASNPPGDGGPATRAAVFSRGVALDHAGNLVEADEGYARIRVVAARTGTFYGQPMTAGDVYTIAGDGLRGSTQDGVPALRTQLRDPEAVVVDRAGNVVVADAGNSQVSVVATGTGTFYGIAMTAGDIYVIANGSAVTGPGGDGGPAVQAHLHGPQGIALDAAGDILIADSGNNRVRVVAATTGSHYGQQMTAGDIYTVAGTGTAGSSGDGGPATAAQLDQPQSVTADIHGDIVIADSGSNRVRVVAATTGSHDGQRMTAGDIYPVAGDGTSGFAGDGGPAAAAELSQPREVAVDAVGDIIVSDAGNHRVRLVAAATGTSYGVPVSAGDIYTIAGDGAASFSGDGGPATRAEFTRPTGVSVDQAGNTLVADWGGARVRVVAAKTGTSYGQRMTAGDTYTVAGDGVAGFSGDGGPATQAELTGPWDLALDGTGDVLINDTGDNRVRMLAETSGTVFGQHVTAGDIYTVAGDGAAGPTGDGGPATAAELSGPYGVTADAAGNLLIADSGNAAVRVVAARTGVYYGQQMTAGDIYTIAGDGADGYSGDGGPATAAGVDPNAVAVDHDGDVLLADWSNDRIRVIAASTGVHYGQQMLAGDIYTIAGDGGTGHSGDGGPATHAAVLEPWAVAVDSGGNVLVTDFTSRVRVVAATTGTFYGQHMTAGDIYTIAGDGHVGYSGDGGTGPAAELDNPFGLAVDHAGAVLIATDEDGRVRRVSG